ncbi:MAG: phosphatidylinositol mannoside acyltransferase [Actinomycetota bacterium]|nr:phosphatidylinositol mannoside acyltransferase [Actinomycetota bacterium]
MSGLVTYYAFVAGARLARLLPERLAYGVAHAGGLLWRRFGGAKRATVTTNLARITGEGPGSPRLERLVREAYKSYARYWLETFRLVEQEPRFFLERFHCAGEGYLAEVLARGRGAIIVVGHLGNWDAAAGWVGASGRSVVTVAEVLEPERLFRFFVRHRQRLGITVHPATPDSAAKLVEAVRGGAVVALLGDRDLRGRGPKVDFFGAPATLPGGPASIALRAGVPLLVAGVYGVVLPDGRRGWQAEIAEPIELPSTGGADAVRSLTAEVACRLEGFVGRQPEEWHVFQPFWIEDRAAPPGNGGLSLGGRRPSPATPPDPPSSLGGRRPSPATPPDPP